MIGKGWGLTVPNQNQESPALGVRMSIPCLAVPVGAVLMLLVTWTSLFLKWQTQQPAAADAAELRAQ